MADFPGEVERLFAPVDAWGEFRRGARPAAVVFILYRSGDRWQVPFVRRRGDMRDHPGQVALPGGGVPLGAGDPMYAAVSNFSVVPFLAHLPAPLPAFVHDPGELEGVLEIPLDRLLDDSAWKESADPWRFRYLDHDDSVVWGLTERLVWGLTPRLRQALAATS